MKLTVLVAAGALLVVATGYAQAPRVVNAAMQQRAVTGSLQALFDDLVRQQAKPAWIGYSVPAVAGHYAGCHGNGEWSDNGGPYYLEGRPSAGARSEERTVKLEGDKDLVVLVRVENQQPGRIAIFSPECEIDAGGLPFFWLTGVGPADSVRMLAATAQRPNVPNRVARAAVTAVALHADPAADVALDQLVAAQQPIELRKQAAFWLGSARGERGYQILEAAVRHDPSADFRKQATFAFSQSKVPAAEETLFQMARSDADASVRGQALFWIAQKAGKRAAGAITDAIANDPEAQVKERAVFALSQLPKDEGVPLLIGVARSNRDPKVRQRAMFWLGQSKDPRAIAFFEEILKAK